MSNIYLNVTIEKNWCFENFNFPSLKILARGQFLGGSNSHRYHLVLKIRGLVAKAYVAFVLF